MGMISDGVKKISKSSILFFAVFFLAAVAAFFVPKTAEAAIAPPAGYLTSPGTMRSWLASLPWSTNPYDAGQNISTYKVFIRDGATAEVKNELFDFLSDTQNTTTGFWGGGDKYIRLSGVFKLIEVYEALGRTLPHATEIYNSTVDAVLTVSDFTIIKTLSILGNPLSVFTYIEDEGLLQRSVPSSERLAVVTKVINNLIVFQKPDGGISGAPYHALLTYQYLNIGQGLANEGDVYGSYHGIGVYFLIYQYLRISAVPPIDGTPYLLELSNPGSQKLSPKVQSINPATINEALAVLGSMQRNVFIWAAKLFDSNTGGFFAEYSSKSDPAKYAPFLDFTGRAVKMLNFGGVADDLPNSMKCKLHDFYQARWNSKDQLYYDIYPHQIMKTFQNSINYANNYAQDVMEILGPRPSDCSGTPTPTCTSFTYSVWSACQTDNTRTRTITSSSPSGCTGGNPITTQSCTHTPAAPSGLRVR